MQLDQQLVAFGVGEGVDVDGRQLLHPGIHAPHHAISLVEQVFESSEIYQTRRTLPPAVEPPWAAIPLVPFVTM